MPNTEKTWSHTRIKTAIVTLKQVVWGFWAADHPHVLRALGYSSRFPGARL